VPTFVSWVKIGLDVEKAKEQSQTAFKVRHLKAGLRLAQALCLASHYAHSSLIDANLFSMIVGLLKEQCMALSLKLSCLTVLDSVLSNNSAMEKFIEFRPDASSNGVAFIIKQWQDTKVTRVKFALNNLIRKVNIYETLCFINRTYSESELSEENKSRLGFALRNICDIYSNVTQKLGQFKRFLPVATHFSFPTTTHNSHTAVYSFMKSSKMLECFFLFLSKFSVEDSINSEVVAMLKKLVASDHGIRFLASQPAQTQAIIKVLVEAKHPLGIEIAYSMRILSILNDLASINLDEMSSDDDIEPLKSLQILCETSVGRFNVAHVLSMAKFSDPLFKIVKIAAPMSTTKNLCLDLIHSTVSLVDEPEYLQNYGSQLRNLFTEENKLAHLSFWVKHFDCTNIQALCQELSSNVDKAKNCTEELIPIVRALRSIALPNVDSSVSEFEDANKRQLLLELFSHDGLSTLSTLLSAIASVFEHPELHTASLAGCKGINVINLVHPSLHLLRAILALVASSQGADFR